MVKKKNLTPTRQIRRAYWKVFQLALKLQHKRKTKLRGTDIKYIRKMGYMAFFLGGGFVPNKKSFVDNWVMPDYDWIKKIERGELK